MILHSNVVLFSSVFLVSLVSCVHESHDLTKTVSDLPYFREPRDEARLSLLGKHIVSALASMNLSSRMMRPGKIESFCRRRGGAISLELLTLENFFLVEELLFDSQSDRIVLEVIYDVDRRKLVVHPMLADSPKRGIALCHDDFVFESVVRSDVLDEDPSSDSTITAWTWGAALFTVISGYLVLYCGPSPFSSDEDGGSYSPSHDRQLTGAISLALAVHACCIGVLSWGLPPYGVFIPLVVYFDSVATACALGLFFVRRRHLMSLRARLLSKAKEAVRSYSYCDATFAVLLAVVAGSLPALPYAIFEDAAETSRIVAPFAIHVFGLISLAACRPSSPDLGITEKISTDASVVVPNRMETWRFAYFVLAGFLIIVRACLLSTGSPYIAFWTSVEVCTFASMGISWVAVNVHLCSPTVRDTVERQSAKNETAMCLTSQKSSKSGSFVRLC